MRPRWIRWAVLIVAVLVIVVYGYQLINLRRETTRLRDYVLNPPGPQPTGEVAVLRAQLEVMRHFDERLVGTVYWALGMIVGIVILLGGFSWYVNFRVYERDKAVMQQDLKNSLDAAVTDAQKALMAEVRRVAEQIGNRVASDMSTKMDRIVRDVRPILFERRMGEARRWERTVPSNAFGDYTRAAEIALDDPLEMGYEVTTALDGMIKLLEGGFRPESFRLSRLKPVLDRLPAEHGDTAKKIRSLAGIPT